METQDSVVAFGRAHYPSESRAERVRGLIEEACELAVATGELSLDDALDTARSVWAQLERKPKSPEHIRSGLADVQIMLYAIAADHGLSAQACLDEKMDKNRKKQG